MFILALKRSSAIDEMADATHARLSTEFGDQTCDPSVPRCLQLTMPFRLTDAEARALHSLAHDIGRIRAPSFDRIVLRQGFIFIEGGELQPIAEAVAGKLGGFAKRTTFITTPHVPVTRILRKEAHASAESFMRSIGIPDPIYFGGVALMQRVDGTHRLAEYTGEAMAA